MQKKPGFSPIFATLLTLPTLFLLISFSFSKTTKAGGPEILPDWAMPCGNWIDTTVAKTHGLELRTLGASPPLPEKLLFNISWGAWHYRWIEAGQATLDILPTESPKHVRFQSLAWCNAFFQKIYPVRDTIYSLINREGLYPIRFHKTLHEGSYNAKVDIWFNQEKGVACSKDTVVYNPALMQDVMSAFYFIRCQKLDGKKTIELKAISGKKIYDLRVLIHGREEIEVPAGRFKTVIVEPVLKDDGIFKAKGKLTIWLSDDARHMPVKMASKIAVGSIRAELLRYTP